MDKIDKNVVFIIEDIKKEILSTRNRVLENANIELISLYFKVDTLMKMPNMEIILLICCQSRLKLSSHLLLVTPQEI